MTIPPILRSFLTTFVATFLSSVPVVALLDGDFSFAAASATAALVASLRTVLAYLDSGMPLFGRGSDATV